MPTFARPGAGCLLQVVGVRAVSDNLAIATRRSALAFRQKFVGPCPVCRKPCCHCHQSC